MQHTLVEWPSHRMNAAGVGEWLYYLLDNTCEKFDKNYLPT